MVDRVDAVAVLLNNEMSRLTSVLRRNGEDNISTREYMRKPTLNERVSWTENVMNCDLASLRERVSMVEDFIKKLDEQIDMKLSPLRETLQKESEFVASLAEKQKTITSRESVVQKQMTAITERISHAEQFTQHNLSKTLICHQYERGGLIL